MNILDHYYAHCQNLERLIESKPLTEVSRCQVAVMAFFTKFDHFADTIERHNGARISIDEMLQAMLEMDEDRLARYRAINAAALAEIDPEDPEPEDIDTIELTLLVAFGAAVFHDRLKGLYELFNQIINILDYYEQFSERPEYWNGLLEKELANQINILKQEHTDLDYYKEIYRDVVFEELDEY